TIALFGALRTPILTRSPGAVTLGTTTKLPRRRAAASRWEATPGREAASRRPRHGGGHRPLHLVGDGFDLLRLRRREVDVGRDVFLVRDCEQPVALELDLADALLLLFIQDLGDRRFLVAADPRHRGHHRLGIRALFVLLLECLPAPLGNARLD